ncbi:TMEM175 family protein [Lysobacter soli]|uniref:TMEM175 family protein n=1 Tax=Lysobacter soli TaxID=453783 RepID=UPI00240FCEA0|nr:TMEM175 family protein [Lysobacter soli]MDG2517346.1 TMEM175 family protein [Lysobacter soli]
MMLRKEDNQHTGSHTHGAERGLSRFEGFSDAVFAIALTLLIVEIKVPGSPDGPQGYSDLVSAIAEQRREFLALALCYVVSVPTGSSTTIRGGSTRRAITGSA